jgi:hypothetical protein
MAVGMGASPTTAFSLALRRSGEPVNTTMSSDRLAIGVVAHHLIFLGDHQEDHNVAETMTMLPSDGPSPSSAPIVGKDNNNISNSTSLVPHAAAANKVKNQSIAKQPPSSVPLAVVAKEDSEDHTTNVRSLHLHDSFGRKGNELDDASKQQQQHQRQLCSACRRSKQGQESGEYEVTTIVCSSCCCGKGRLGRPHDKCPEPPLT